MQFSAALIAFVSFLAVARGAALPAAEAGYTEPSPSDDCDESPPPADGTYLLGNCDSYGNYCPVSYSAGDEYESLYFQKPCDPAATCNYSGDDCTWRVGNEFANCT